MSYTALANTKQPALIIYVLDVSSSMNQLFGSRKRIEIVQEALHTALRKAIFFSTKGRRVSPRYQIAIYTYSDRVVNMFNGTRSITEIAQEGLPRLALHGGDTDPASAFLEVDRLLNDLNLGDKKGPAPLVCHMTDGEYTRADPEPAIRQIMQKNTPDGTVLVENIFISDKILTEPVSDPITWRGITPETPLLTNYARKLRACSSPLPTLYREQMAESGYAIAANAVMMIPGSTPDLVEMGFVMSTATPVA